MTSSSRTLPPGWMMALMPMSAARSTLSRNGKNASLAMYAPRTGLHAFTAAMLVESMRLICPAPMPMEASRPV